jgi:hypothetical protein
MAFDEFRGFDLRPRMRRIERAMNLVPPVSGDDIPVIAHTPCYFGFGNAPRPAGYWHDPALMLSFQQDGYEAHLRNVEDDTVPYFMPWFGTGVLATAFGCAARDAAGDGDDPAVTDYAVKRVSDITRLKKPEPDRDGWMPRVLRFMEYAARHGEMPVGATDLNSPLCTAAQVCGYENLFLWMYDEPEAVEDLMALITESFIDWVRLQREICGETPGQSHGLQGVWTPKGGVWLSDDDLVSLSPPLYERFLLPHYNRIFDEFGGGHLHWCGLGTHQLKNVLRIRSLTSVNNSPMGNWAAFQALYDALGGKLCIQIQDSAPVDPDAYYQSLFAKQSGMTGVMVATFVEDVLAMAEGGRTVFVKHDPIEKANLVVRAVRKYGQQAIERGKENG